MKTKSSLFAALGVLALASQAFSQNATTTPVGAQTIEIGLGRNPVGLSMLNDDVLRSSVDSVSGTLLSIAGQGNVGGLLEADSPYYLEVYSGELKSERFEINVALTVQAANGTIAINATSPLNTRSYDAVASLLTGANVSLRKHITLDQLQSQCSPGLLGNNNPTLADQIAIYDPSSSGYISYYLRGDSVTWRRVGSTATANKTSIPPGIGFFFEKKGIATTLTSLGNVRVNDFAIVLYAGNQLLAPPAPVDISPEMLGGSSSNMWTGNNNPSYADKISVYRRQLGGYESYYLRGDGLTWRKEGTTTVVTTTGIVPSDSSFFVHRKQADNAYLIPNLVSE